MRTFAEGLGMAILAAGRSSRMGRPKLLLPWRDTTVLGHLVNEWKTLGVAQVAVVVAAEDRALLSELNKLGFSEADCIVNPEPQRGMFSSVKCAVTWSGWDEELTHWGLALGDQPHLSRGTLQRFLVFCAANRESICQPSRQGRGRHPVILPEAAFAQLGLSAAETLKEFLGKFKVAYCEMEDPGLDLDLDRPEDYARALKEFGGSLPKRELPRR
jgi:molybdenum cofactor cytidylyltransferase